MSDAITSRVSRSAAIACNARRIFSGLDSARLARVTASPGTNEFRAACMVGLLWCASCAVQDKKTS